MQNSQEHLDPTAELTLDVVKQKAVKGALTLTGRTFFFQIINRVGDLLLTIFLGVSQYGIFWMVSSVVNFFAYFSDIGLAAALIQKKEQVTDEELKVTFTIQQILVLSLVLLLFLISPLLRTYYHLSQEGVWLLYALGISFFLSSLKTIPSVLLERRLNFAKLIIPQIAEVVVFNLIAVYLAWRGMGVTSFTIAVVGRGMVGLVVMYALQPWRPGFSFSFSSAKGLFRFGVPYQLNTFLAVFKDDGVNIVLGGLLGPMAMGLLGWAQRWAFAPLRFFMDQVIKVTFPAYSRMQDDKEELSRAVSRSIFFVTFLVFPSLIGLVLLAPELTMIIPKYEKWQPALIALSLFSINSAWAAVTTPLTNLMNAIGKIKTTFKLMIMWTGLTWAVVPVLASLYGVNGAAAGSAIVGTSSIVAIFVIMKQIRINLDESVGIPIVGSLIMGIALFGLKPVLPVSLPVVLVLVFVGVVVYFGTVLLLGGPSVTADFRKAYYALRKK